MTFILSHQVLKHFLGASTYEG